MAAAYAALASLSNDLEIIPNHATHSFSFDNKQISSLVQTVEILIDFIETYDSHGEAAHVFESRIVSVANAAHNVIESHIVDQINSGFTRCGNVRSYFLLDLQRAINSMEFVKRKTMQFKAKSGSKAEQPTYSSSSSLSPPAAATSSEPLKNNDMVGFDVEAVRRLVEILAGPSNQRLVIPVPGMGGLGKTSLTKAVYEHFYVKHNFHVRLWATISQQYNAQNILTQLLDGENESTTGGDAGELGDKLHKRLWRRRYLIVLDDMWSLEAWDMVRRYLPENGKGSRVVVTTRLSDIAAHFSSPFNLNLLDKDKSWELFRRKAFGEEGCPIELEEIGKKIVKRCRGLPLSIVVIGGHLRRSSRGIEYWEKVAGYMNPISSVGAEEQCLEILRLSYQHLPACLKPCFLYLATLQEDQLITAYKLLQRWMAQGFLRAKRGLSMEEIGAGYLKDLIDMNLILVHTSSWNGEVKYCGVHDSVREVCLKVCKKEKFLCEADDITTQVRRIVIPKGKNFNSHTIGAKQLSPPPLRLSADCSLLRVLLRHIQINRDGTCLPSAHFQPVNSNARALDLEQYRLQSIYSILTSLPACWNLQILHTEYSPSDGGPLSLRYEIWEMPQLRILEANDVFLTDPIPAEGSDEQEEGTVLRNLHTLEGVVNLRLTEEVCKRMPNLKRLRVRYDLFYDDPYLHNLGRFHKLKSLSISFDNDSKWCDVVPTLKLPTSLEKLSLSNCHLGWEDLTRMISSPLPHLGSLYVSSVGGSEWNLDEEVFYCLKRLEIFYCADLIHWNANSSHFPVLEHLVLYDTPKLSEIPLDIEDIPTLRLIQLVGCRASTAVSALRMVVEQEIEYGIHGIHLDVEFAEDDGEGFERFQGMIEEECLTTKSIHIYYDDQKITF